MSEAAAPIDSLWTAVQDARLIVAAIGIAGVVLGSAATAMFRARYDLRQEQRLREQRQRDLLVAIHAEILAGVGASGWQVSQSEYDYAIENASPFGSPDDNDFVFKGAFHELAVLPAPIVHSIVEYYRLAAQSNALTRELRIPEFASQEIKEREKFMIAMMTVLDLQRAAGERAVADIAIHLPDADLTRRKDEFAMHRKAATERAEAREQARRRTLESRASTTSDDGDDRAAHSISPRTSNIRFGDAE